MKIWNDGRKQIEIVNYMLGTALQYMPTMSKNKVSAFTRNVEVKHYVCLRLPPPGLFGMSGPFQPEDG
jgi:hypothetical protein